jgi:hypothetical protein
MRGLDIRECLSMEIVPRRVDQSPDRAFSKIRSRVQGTALAALELDYPHDE